MSEFRVRPLRVQQNLSSSKMKRLLIILVILLTTFSGQSQTAPNWCAFDSENNELNATHPGREQSIHEQISRITNGQAAGFTDRTDPIIIPVVVHVIHDGGSGNISYAQIMSGIDMLNEDFNRLNADTTATRSSAEAPFAHVAADTEISFELAKIDPDGNCTNGVERRFSPSTSYNASNNAKHYSQGGLDAWNRNDYMNIWIVNSIESSGGGVTLGYAEFPYSGGSSNYGVIIRHDAYGSIGTASGDRTLTHEIGHCLGLYHTFQGGCHDSNCGDSGDHCCDTPPESEAHWSCGPAQNSCTDIPTGDLYGFDAYDQWENFMSYAPCQNMYSEDQKTIMLGNLANIPFLTNLVSLANQSETGVGLPAVLCSADFLSSSTVICSGETVNFYDESYFNVSTRAWSFAGGTPAVSSDQDPLITYNTPGVYAVSLEVSDGISTVNKTVTNYIIVLADSGSAPPYSEGFENYTVSSFPDNQQFVVQNDDGGQTWDIFDQTSYAGNQCLKLKNYAETDGSQDAFYSGTIDLSSVDPSDEIVFNFRYAYKKRSDNDDEWLQVYVSKDCGETWILRKNIHGDALSESTQTWPYQPAQQDEWTFVEVTNINSDFYVENFRYKFVFTNDDGNNIYIDNINLYPLSMTGLTESTASPRLSVYPNPASNYLTLTYTSEENTTVNISVTNSLGQIVYSSVYSGEALIGKNDWIISTESLEAGIYFITIETENGNQTVKFIKE